MQVVSVSAAPGDVLTADGIGASAGAGAGSVAPGRSGARVIRVGPGAKVPRPHYDMRLPFDFGMGEFAQDTAVNCVTRDTCRRRRRRCCAHIAVITTLRLLCAWSCSGGLGRAGEDLGVRPAHAERRRSRAPRAGGGAAVLHAAAAGEAGGAAVRELQGARHVRGQGARAGGFQHGAVHCCGGGHRGLKHAGHARVRRLRADQ